MVHEAVTGATEHGEARQHLRLGKDSLLMECRVRGARDEVAVSGDMSTSAPDMALS